MSYDEDTHTLRPRNVSALHRCLINTQVEEKGVGSDTNRPRNGENSA